MVRWEDSGFLAKPKSVITARVVPSTFVVRIMLLPLRSP